MRRAANEQNMAKGSVPKPQERSGRSFQTDTARISQIRPSVRGGRNGARVSTRSARLLKQSKPADFIVFFCFTSLLQNAGSFFGYDHVLTEAQTARANSSD